MAPKSIDSQQRLEKGFLVFIKQAFGLSGSFNTAFALSFLIQVGFVTYLVLEVPPPPRAIPGEIDDRVLDLVVTRIEEEEELEVPEEVEEPEVELAIEEPEPEPEPEPDEEEELEVDEPPEELAREIPALRDMPAYQGFGSSEDGVEIYSGRRSSQGTRSSAREETEGEVQTAVTEQEEERPQRRRRPRPVRLEDAGEPPVLVDGEPSIGYPRQYREAAISGLVVLQCIITEDGRVRACRPRSGPEELAEYVESVVRRWRYEPARDHSGEEIPVAFTYRVPFRLI